MAGLRKLFCSFFSLKSFLALLAFALLGMCALAAPAEACTAVYVGSKASTDGSIIIARSNDLQGVHGNHIEVVERVENKPDRTMPIDDEQTIFTEIPATTYHYIGTPWMDSTTAAMGASKDAAACINEYGVMMTMSVTAFSNKNALRADPLVEHGITEDNIDDLVVCQSKTAREAVEVLLGLIDTYGSSEINIALIADQNEAWYIEMYSGYQYAAVRLPEDKVCVCSATNFRSNTFQNTTTALFPPSLKACPKIKGLP